MKNFIWGVLLFVLNIFILYQNYTKNFTFPTTFFIESNQMMSFIIGIVYAQQCRKLDFRQILGIASNSFVFAILTTILFWIYGAPVKFQFTVLLFIGIFICMFISYWLYYWLFCPTKYKTKYKNKYKRKKYQKHMNKQNLNKQ